MSEIFSNVRIGRFSVHDVEQITQAKLLEEDATLSWESSDANRATRQAAVAIGESASVSDFLVARARAVKQLITEQNPLIKPRALRFVAPAWLSWALFALAFIGGLLADQLTASGSRINLLSFPFFGVLLWNLCVYVFALIAFVRSRRSDVVGAKRLFEAIENTMLGDRLKADPVLIAAASPMTGHIASRAFHLAALGFVLGMILSVFIRGLGTSYVVGWESTWLAESPEVVYHIVNFCYGALSSVVAPLPNIMELANMRFDRMAIHGTDATASLWLIRMIIMLTIVVVIPRLIFVLVHTFKIARLSRDYPINLNERYFGDVLRAWRAEALTLDLLVPTSNASQATVESAYRLAEAMGFNLSEVKTHTWDCTSETAPLSLEIVSHAQQVWALMNATTTPEFEVQGEALKLVKDKMGNTPVILLVDLAGYIARFGDFADRITHRKNLWMDFGREVGINVVFYHGGLRPDEETCEALKFAIKQ